MSSMQLLLIFGPLLAMALLVSFLTRSDPIIAKSIKQIQQRPLNRLVAVVSYIAGPIWVLLMLNNLFGAFLLIISGVIFVFQDKLFPDVFWIRGIAAKFVGVVYLVTGVSLAFYQPA